MLQVKVVIYYNSTIERQFNIYILSINKWSVHIATKEDAWFDKILFGRDMS